MKDNIQKMTIEESQENIAFINIVQKPSSIESPSFVFPGQFEPTLLNLKITMLILLFVVSFLVVPLIPNKTVLSQVSTSKNIQLILLQKSEPIDQNEKKTKEDKKLTIVAPKEEKNTQTTKSIEKQISPSQSNKIQKKREIQQIDEINNKILNEQLIKFYRQKGNITIVDFGTGKCNHIFKLKEQGFNIQGLDNIERHRDFKKVGKIVNIKIQQNFTIQYDWVQSLQIDDRYLNTTKLQYLEQQAFFTNLYKLSKSGIILRWRNPLDWKMEEVTQFLQQFGFIYNAQITKEFKQKLITVEHQHLMIYDKKEPPIFKYSINQQVVPKITLGIFTIFIMNENIPFLREWIIYHLKLGVDKFFFYDNTGSIGRNGATATVNKYGFQFRRLINATDQQLRNQWNSILRLYGKYIVYQVWQPKNQKGQITYNHSQGIKHYLKTHGSETNFTAFLDIDQFLYSQKNVDIKSYILQKRSQGITKLVIKQKKFKDRFCSLNKKITETTQWFDFDTQHWDPKLIIQTNVTIAGIMHWLKIKEGLSLEVPMNELRFNHYNTNKGTWVRFSKFKKLNKEEEQKLKQEILSKNTIDNGMMKFGSIIDSNCRDKCSDKNIKISFKNQQQFDTLCRMKE